jgi:hypothetical protein
LGFGVAASTRFASAGRTRTCNQTVLSGRIKDAAVDFAAFSFEIVRVRYLPSKSRAVPHLKKARWAEEPKPGMEPIAT